MKDHHTNAKVDPEPHDSEFVLHVLKTYGALLYALKTALLSMIQRDELDNLFDRNA